MHEVIKKFTYAPDIHKNVKLKKGDTVELVSDVVEGLVNEGYINPNEIETKTVTLETTKPVVKQPVPVATQTTQPK